jgi:hypothetical protein
VIWWSLSLILWSCESIKIIVKRPSLDMNNFKQTVTWRGSRHFVAIPWKSHRMRLELSNEHFRNIESRNAIKASWMSGIGDPVIIST